MMILITVMIVHQVHMIHQHDGDDYDLDGACDAGDDDDDQ